MWRRTKTNMQPWRSIHSLIVKSQIFHRACVDLGHARLRTLTCCKHSEHKIVGAQPTTRGSTTCPPRAVHRSSIHADAEREDIAKPTPKTFTNHDTNTAMHPSAHSRAASHSRRTIGPQPTTRGITTCRPLVMHHSNMRPTWSKKILQSRIPNHA